MGWTELRPIQIEAIHEVFDGQGDLIIAARTASGKTEAAFLPILSKVVEAPADGVQAIYAGPLKALINDQFPRLERLCEIAEIPVHKWHGDVGPGAKKRLLENPRGVLLITPESIESLFVNHPQTLNVVFGRLAFVVIDELHAFLGSERGAHLRSLISRLSKKSREPVRVVGLSATLGDPMAARRWLLPSDPERVRLIEDAEGKSIRLRLSGYGSATDAEQPDESLERDVFDAFIGRTSLIFGNSKKRIEQCAAFAKRECAHRGLPDRFRVHHGSLSKPEREETEDALRSSDATATFCSSTLELGIDVGNVQAVGQLGAPWSVASLAQRLGRSGRKEGESSELRIYISEPRPGEDAHLVERLFPELLHATAMVELLLSKWHEPPEVDRWHLSTLVQQLLSTIAERGGESAQGLYTSLCAQGGFALIDAPTFTDVLRCLGSHDLIEQTPEGVLVLGLKGERIVRSQDFYTAFVIAEEYRVTHKGRLIGTIAQSPAVMGGEYLVLGGQNWKIVQVDTGRREILVEPSTHGTPVSFMGQANGEIDPKVRETIRELLGRDDTPSFLDANASAMLDSARKSARDAGLDTTTFVTVSNVVSWFPWTGTRVVRTLAILGREVGGLSVAEDRHELSLSFPKATGDEIRAIYLGFLKQCPSPEELASKMRSAPVEKYEAYLSESLRARANARDRLDVAGALEVIRQHLMPVA